MAKPRPASCYRRLERAYSRTAKKKPRKAYIKGAPDVKTTHYDLGNSGKKYKYMVCLVANNGAQIRSSALESCRIIINRTIQTKLTPESYHLQIRAFPHHVLRENAMISGAGADRLQTGMSHGFGRPIARAAQVRTGKILFSIKVDSEKDVELATKALKKVIPKLPVRCSIKVVS